MKTWWKQIEELKTEVTASTQQVAVLGAENTRLHEELAYLRALLENKKLDEEPEEQGDAESSRTVEHRVDGKDKKPAIPRGWKSFTRRRREYEKAHSRKATGKQLSIAVNTAAMLSDPRTPMETKNGKDE